MLQKWVISYAQKKKKQKHQNMHQNDLTSIKILELCRKSKDHFFCFMNPFCLLVQQWIYLIALQHLFLKTQFLVNFEKRTILWDMTKLGKGHDSNSGFKLQVTLHHCKSWGILPMRINFWCQPIIMLNSYPYSVIDENSTAHKTTTL